MMKRKEDFLISALLFVSLMISGASAGIYFSQPESSYNLGDIISIKVTTEPVLEGFLKVDLICSGNPINVFNGVPDETGIVTVKFPLTFSYIQENTGNCHFEGSYSEGDVGKSANFEISKALKLRLDTDSLIAKPGEEIIISGMVERLNGAGVDGEVQITIPLLRLMEGGAEAEPKTKENQTKTANQTEENTEQKEEPTQENNVDTGVFYGRASGGVFSITFKLKENTPAGDYRIDVLSYEKDDAGRKTSEGFAMANLKILQITKEIDVAINSQSIDPGTPIEFRPAVLDQSGQPIKTDVSIIITNEAGERAFQQILPSDQTSKYNIPTNLSAGYYEITASYQDMEAKKKFYVNEKAIASFEIKNASLIVTNIGNIPYKKDIQVEMNGKPFLEKVNLELGGLQEFKLEGDGEFDVKVSDGENEISQGGILLTGRAVDVEPVKENSVMLNTPIVWISFIVILAIILLFLLRKVLRKKSFAYPIIDKFKFRSKNKTADLTVKTADGVPKISPETPDESIKKTLIENATRPQIVTGAEHSIVLNGAKNKVAVLCLKIKNKPNADSIQKLETIIKEISDNKGCIYKKGEYIFGIFSPLVTKTPKNEVIAAKVAAFIQNALKQHNQKFADKIEFGMAIHSGQIADKIEDGKLKFTPLGNIIATTKKLADSSIEQVLLTKDTFESAGREIRAIKNGENYEIRRIVDGEKNNEFIQRFLARAGKDEKPKTQIIK